ncbi:hypothetical protein KEG38_41765 [Polyangium jinanense]|nr:hypothetical protein [Polyangium jinanense]
MQSAAELHALRQDFTGPPLPEPPEPLLLPELNPPAPLDAELLTLLPEPNPPAPLDVELLLLLPELNPPAPLDAELLLPEPDPPVPPLDAELLLLLPEPDPPVPPLDAELLLLLLDEPPPASGETALVDLLLPAPVSLEHPTDTLVTSTRQVAKRQNSDRARFPVSRITPSVSHARRSVNQARIVRPRDTLVPVNLHRPEPIHGHYQILPHSPA